MLLTIFLWATIGVALWSGLIRPWLRKKPWWTEHFFNLPLIEWIEINVYRKSETLAWGRWLAFVGTAITTIAQFDPATAQTLVQMFEPVLPESMKWVAKAIPMVITLAGLFTTMQRRDTTKPLEMVEIASDAPVEAKQAAHVAEMTTKAAVADIKAATAAEEAKG